MEPKMKQVAVVGAGISGLVTANAMQQQGYKVTVFEKASTIGESWERGTYYTGEVAQSVRKDYTFYGSDIPPLSGEWPDGEEMQEYLEAYALKTGVHQLISFQTNVQNVYSNASGWKISARKDKENQYRELQFDAVVICTGMEWGSFSYWPLHRNIAVANSGSIGFVGMNGSLFFTLTAIIAAHWMAAYLSGAIQLSTHQSTRYQPKQYNKRRQVSQLIHYLNQLLKDMGGKPPASSNLLFRLLGTPFKPGIYAALAKKLTNSHASLFHGPYSRSCFS
jgi:hypothetical protein